MSSFDFEAVIFDIDGVILDSMSLWEDLGVRYLRSFGITPEEGLNVKLFAMSMEQGAEYLSSNYKELGKSASELLAELRDLIRNFYLDEVLAKNGAVEFLEYLSSKGIRITAATSSPHDYVEGALGRLNLLKHFERIFTTTEVGESKHSPLIYNLACRSMDATPARTIVCEDSLYALKTASKAGYITIGVFDASGEKNQEELKTSSSIYVRDLSEAIKALA